MKTSRGMSRFGCAVVVVTLGGCATYHREPLPTAADLAPSVTIAVADLRRNSPGVVQEIDPAAPLDERAVAALAVLNNPDLRAERLKAGVAHAQVFEAGLLPDPQVQVGVSRSSEHVGYDANLSEELRSILTRGARRAAATAQSRQVNLQVLWQEWQVAERARELFIQLGAEPGLRALLTTDRQLLRERYERDRQAMAQNAATAGTVTADSMALTDADTQLRELALQTNDADHALHALLGLEPSAPLHFAELATPPLLQRDDFTAAVAAVPNRRPDLLALRAGYESQEERVRAAVLGQFPAITLGVDRARSAEEGVNTVGVGLGVTLPLFDANRGQIAVARATREQLRQEYQARLDQATNDADRLWQRMQLLNQQRRELDAQIATLRQSADAADRDFRAGNLSLGAYSELRRDLNAQQIAAIRLTIALAQAHAALVVVLGWEP